MEALRNHFRQHTNPPVFFISAAIILIFVILGIVFPSGMSNVLGDISSFIYTNFGWWYMLIVSAFIVLALLLAITRIGRIKLGPDDSRPEFGNWAWFSMLFTAGMGIGLVFYGVSEPLSHFQNPPTGDGGTPAAALTSMNYTLFNWTISPWAIYAVLGLGLGYFAFRRGLPMRPATAFYPLIGNRINGPIGHLVDILAVFGTIFGLATSLGLGALQISSGLDQTIGIGGTGSALTPVIVIAVLSAIAITSVMLGIKGGIRRLSLGNMYLAIILAIIVFLVAGPIFILNFWLTSVGTYLQTLPETTLNLFAFSTQGSEFMSSWTLFYWGWWISWSPFVGMFIARISYGYTIRKFVLGSIFVPAGASSLWFAIFGGNAIHLLMQNSGSPLADVTNTSAMFVYLDQLPWGGIIAAIFGLLAIVVVGLFFATSSDSGSLVVDILTNGGDPNPDWRQRLFWAVTEGAVAIILLVAGYAAGSSQAALSALQSSAVAVGLPFSVVLALVAVGLVKALSQDRVPAPDEPAPEPEPSRAATRPRGAPSAQQFTQQFSAENPQEGRDQGRT